MSSIVRSAVNRAVHLRIEPRPQNLGETRAIMRLLSQFGEIEYFKNLKYDYLSAPDASLVIYKSDEAAQHCLRRSPIRFRMGKASVRDESASRDEDHSAGDQSSVDMDPLQQPADRPSTQLRPLEALSDPRLCQIQVHPARVNFRDQIDVNQYHGPFAIDSKSVAQRDLASSVPMPGLSCVNWRAASKPWRIIQAERFRENTSNQRRKSLRELYDDATKARAASDT